MSLIKRMILSSAYAGIGFGLAQAMLATIYLEKGVLAWQIGTVFAIFGLSAALFEIPLGTIADNYGRLKVYRISVIIKILAMFILFLGSSFEAILLYAFIAGLSSAVATGTSSVWFVEELNRQGKGELLGKYQSYLQLATLFAMVLSAMVAGYLPPLLGSFFVSDVIKGANWIVAILLIKGIMEYFLSFYFYKEGEKVFASGENKVTFYQTFQKAIANIAENKIIIEMFIITTVMMSFAALIESYWQPRIYEFDPSTDYRIFGYVTAGFFGMQLIGGVVSSVISSSQKINKQWFIRIMMVITSLLFTLMGMMNQLVGFIALYCTFVAAPILANPFIFTLIHQETRDENRSTLVSIQSFIISLVIGLKMLVVPYVVKIVGISAMISLYGIIGIIIFFLILVGFRTTQAVSS